MILTVKAGTWCGFFTSELWSSYLYRYSSTSLLSTPVCKVGKGGGKGGRGREGEGRRGGKSEGEEEGGNGEGRGREGTLVFLSLQIFINIFITYTSMQGREREDSRHFLIMGTLPG